MRAKTSTPLRVKYKGIEAKVSGFNSEAVKRTESLLERPKVNKTSKTKSG